MATVDTAHAGSANPSLLGDRLDIPGDLPFFAETRWACVLYHINGNAIYDVGGGQFRKFYFG